MKNKFKIVLSLAVIAAFAITACAPGQNSHSTEELKAQIETLNGQIKELTEKNQGDRTVKQPDRCLQTY